MSQQRKRAASIADTTSTTNMFTGTEPRGETQLSPHVITAGTQLIGKLLPEFSGEKCSTGLKSRPASQRKDSAYAMVIPTAPNDVSDSWEGKATPKVHSQPERTTLKGYPRPQMPSHISPAHPSTARDASSIKVVLKGKTVPKGRSGALSPIEKGSKMSALVKEDGKTPLAPPVTRSGTEISGTEFSSVAPIPVTLAQKPAILPWVGNVKALPLAEKKKKVPKYKVSLKKPKTKLEPILPEKKEEAIKMYNESAEINSERKQSPEMGEAHCAVKMMVHEAMVMTQSEARPFSGKTNVIQKASSVEIRGVIQSGSAPRSVDEIIESLWEQVDNETISESDRRIQEIMNRVMSRGTSQKMEKIQEISGENQQQPEVVDEFSGNQTIVEEEERTEEEGGKETFFPPEHENNQEEMILTDMEPATTEEDDVCITAASGPWDIESLHEQDLNKLKAALDLPMNVSREDILSMKGESIKSFSRVPPANMKEPDQKKKTEMSFLSSWNPKDIITGGGITFTEADKEIYFSKPSIKQHHFCSISREFEMQAPFTHVGWHYHTPNKILKDFPIKDCRESLLNMEKGILSGTRKFTETSEGFDEILDEWLGHAENMFTDIELTIKGNKAPTIMNDNIHFWTLSPPKLHVLPNIIKQMMFPQYSGSFFPGKYLSNKSRQNLSKSAKKRKISDMDDMTDDEIEKLLKERLLDLKSHSTEELTNPYPVPYLKDILPAEIMLKAKTLSTLSTLLEIQKCRSDTYCPKERDKLIVEPLPSDFETLNKEMIEHKKRIGEMNKKRQEREAEELTSTSDIYREDRKGKDKDHIPASKLRDYFRANKNRLKRSQSVITVKKPKILKVIKSAKQKKKRDESSSVDLGVMQEKTAAMKAAEKNRRKSLSSSGNESAEDLEDELSVYNRRKKLSRWLKSFTGINPPWWTEMGESSEPVSYVLPYEESKIDYSNVDPEQQKQNEKILEEIKKLTNQIDKAPANWIFDTCRRGVLYRKIGELNHSFQDLNKVIRLEPAYLDAYWHRHFVHILRGNFSAALEDLNYILDHKPQYKVYLALGLLYEHQNNPTVAMSNYTKAVAFDESQWLAYYYRAKLYEAAGKTKFSTGDFLKVAEKNPTHIEALKKQAAFFLASEKWKLTISKCTRFLEMVTDADVFLYRAEAYIREEMWKDALNDLTTAIHFGPSLWKAFYLRACLLKNDKKQWDRALMDFSISLLLNDSEENISCFNYRGVLYIKTKCPEQAASDFKSVLAFEPDNINALLNLGLVKSKDFQSFPLVVDCFTRVLRLDPFNIKAYEFRAKIYTKLFKYNTAIKDYMRIIHMEPHNYRYYIFMGSVFLKMKRLDLASYFIKLIANVADSIDLPSELAAVHSYLGDMSRALAVLEQALAEAPDDIDLLMSLGKTQLKSKLFQGALSTFQKLKVFMVKNKKKRKWPPGSDEVFYHLGLVYMELKEYKKALGPFNHAVDINPKHASSFYCRGLSKIHLNYVQCVIDFNRALAIEPRYFEVYLSRAAYYALKKNYTKAILNCNEALKIHKNSIRAFLYRGSIKFSIHAYQLAIDDLTKAIQLNANCALAFFNRANCYESLEEYKSALQDYSIVLLISEDLSYDALINRGCLYYQLEEFSNAREDFRDASILKPYNYNIIHGWGLSLHKLGKLDEAIEKFTACIEMNCHFSDAYISRGNVYMDFVSEKETILARYDYQRAIKEKPDDVLARICLGYSLQVSGKFTQAWHQFSEAFVIDPKSIDALEGRATVFLQMSNNYAAFQDLSAAIRIKPTAELYNNRGVVNQFMKCLRDAMTDYKHAIELDPEYALAYYNAANIYLHGRFFKQALKYFDEAIRLDPTDECAFINRAVTKVMIKDVKGASADFAQALDRCPYYAHIYYNRGNLYASLQMYELAEKDFTSALGIILNDPMTLVQRANVRGKMGMKDLAIADYRRAMEIKDKIRK